MVFNQAHLIHYIAGTVRLGVAIYSLQKATTTKQLKPSQSIPLRFNPRPSWSSLKANEILYWK